MSTSIIIGAGTSVSFGGACVVSAQWGYNPGHQPAYCLDGSFGFSDTHSIYKPTQTLSITTYAGSSISYNCSPSTSCTDADRITASVSPATCNGSAEGVSGSWYVQSYSFSKSSKDQPGQESWGLIKYKDVPSPSSNGTTVFPEVVIITSATGERSSSDVGVVLDVVASASTGSVSANSIGTASITEHGFVTAVGGASTSVDIGNGSASITLNPLYY